MATRCSSSDSRCRSFGRGPLAALALAAAFAIACAGRAPAPEAPEAPPRPETVTIVSLADFHGALEPRILETAGGETVEVGGAALVAAYVARIREEASGPVIIVDGGDMWQGSLASNLQEGAPVVRFYNHLGVAAAALGNHEFDFGPDGTDRIVPMEDGDDPRGALKARAAESDFPLLAANVRDETGEIPEWASPSVMVSARGVRVGITGGATVHTPTTTVGANLVGLEFLPLPDPVTAEASRLREAGAEVVVVAVHAGSGCRDNTDPDDLSSCRDGELLELVRAVPEGLVDVFTGGHTHQGVAKRKRGAAVIQPFARGSHLTWATVFLDGSRPPEVHGPVALCGAVVEGPDGPSCRADHVREHEGPVSPATFFDRPIAPDAEVIALLAPDLERAADLKRRPLNVEATAIVGRAYGAESALGNLVADVLRASVVEADAGMTNGGGLRAELPAGPLTYGHLFEALPFDNRVALLEVDGATLRRIVVHGHAGGHGALSWSGLSFAADGCDVSEISVAGAPLDDGVTYRVVTNDYLAGGGSGFGGLGIASEAIQVLWDKPLMRDLVADGLAEWEDGLDPLALHDPDAPRLRVTGTCDVAR
jgi:5'-nucleotidase